jgi:hypothetical protein
MKTMQKRLSTAALLCLMLFVSAAANAASKFDGSSNLICAAFDITACVDGVTCAKGQARTFNMPEFLSVNFKKKTVHADYDGDKTADSPFENFQSTDSQLIMQGVENDHGWTLAISKKTGRMSVSAVGEEVSFTMFGACKAL